VQALPEVGRGQSLIPTTVIVICTTATETRRTSLIERMKTKATIPSDRKVVA
jgi:hypothetical protein